MPEKPPLILVFEGQTKGLWRRCTNPALKYCVKILRHDISKGYFFLDVEECGLPTDYICHEVETRGRSGLDTFRERGQPKKRVVCSKVLSEKCFYSFRTLTNYILENCNKSVEIYKYWNLVKFCFIYLFLRIPKGFGSFQNGPEQNFLIGFLGILISVFSDSERF